MASGCSSVRSFSLSPWQASRQCFSASVVQGLILRLPRRSNKSGRKTVEPMKRSNKRPVLISHHSREASPQKTRTPSSAPPRESGESEIEMNFLRCPACDGVLEPFQRGQQEALGCQSCGRCFSPDYLEELEGWFERGQPAPSQSNQIASIESPNIARRVYGAIRPKPSQSQRLRGLFFRGWASSVVFFTLFGYLNMSESDSWASLLPFAGLGAMIGLLSGVVWVCFFLTPEGDAPSAEDGSAREVMEEPRHRDRLAVERIEGESGPNSAIQARPLAEDRPDAIKRTPSDDPS